MSDMEMFYGKVIRSDRTDVPEINDEDEYYDWEGLQNGRTYYRINNVLFEVTAKTSGIDVYGGTLLIPPSGTKEYRFLCYWYNGGAGEREVIESAITDMFDLSDENIEESETLDEGQTAMVATYLNEMSERGDGDAKILLKMIKGH